MPMYDFQCPDCMSVTSRYRKIDDRNNPLKCQCSGEMRLAILSAPFGVVQPEAHYLCPATGRKITSWAQRRNSFAEFGLEAADPDQQNENMQKNLRRKAEREKIAENYLPKDLKEKISKIGQNSDNPFHS